MSFCDRCGEQLKEGTKFCPRCGNPVDASGNTQYNQGQNQQYQGQYQNAYQTNPYQNGYNDVSQNKAMAILSYIGILCLIPLFAAKDSPYARFHVNQGLVLFLCETVAGVAVGILTGIFNMILFPLSILIGILYVLLSAGFLVLMILGIINAALGQQKELPIIGKIRLLK